jgi:hypothetical protein
VPSRLLAILAILLLLLHLDAGESRAAGGLIHTAEVGGGLELVEADERFVYVAMGRRLLVYPAAAGDDAEPSDIVGPFARAITSLRPMTGASRRPPTSPNPSMWLVWIRLVGPPAITTCRVAIVGHVWA